LTGLTENTTYYYKVTSCDAFSNCRTFPDDTPYNFSTTV
jgi:hypothetical protein